VLSQETTRMTATNKNTFTRLCILLSFIAII
jgi:hypothetical protein